MRWSLRVLLIAMAGIGVCLGAWRYFRDAESYQKAIRQMARAGDSLVQDVELAVEFGAPIDHRRGSRPPAKYSWRFQSAVDGCGCERDFLLDPNVSWNVPLYSSTRTNADRLGDRRRYRIGPRLSRNRPQIFAVVGPDTAFEALWVSDSPDRDVLPNDLILLMDANLGDVHWMEPIDIEVADHLPTDASAKPKPLPPAATSRGRYVYFVDGVVWLLSKATPDAAITKLFTIESAQEHDRKGLLGKYRLDEFVSPGLGEY